MDIEKEMLKGYIDIIILSMLFKGDLYGYELAKRVKIDTENTFEMKEGTLYLAFKRLEQNGLISSYWGDENTGSRRRYYKLLAAGKKHLRARKKRMGTSKDNNRHIPQGGNRKWIGPKFGNNGKDKQDGGTGCGRAKSSAQKSFDRDFAEEIRTYLKDGLKELMDAGHTEEEALKLTMEKFDVAELKENFSDFAKEFEWFGVDDYKKIKYSDIVMNRIMTRAIEKSPATGLFYGAFIILGSTIGAFLGFLLGHTWVNIIIGFAVGLFVGISFGLLSDALITMIKDLYKAKRD